MELHADELQPYIQEVNTTNSLRSYTSELQLIEASISLLDFYDITEEVYVDWHDLLKTQTQITTLYKLIIETNIFNTINYKRNKNKPHDPKKKTIVLLQIRLTIGALQLITFLSYEGRSTEYESDSKLSIEKTKVEKKMVLDSASDISSIKFEEIIDGILKQYENRFNTYLL